MCMSPTCRHDRECRACGMPTTLTADGLCRECERDQNAADAQVTAPARRVRLDDVRHLLSWTVAS